MIVMPGECECGREMKDQVYVAPGCSAGAFRTLMGIPEKAVIYLGVLTAVNGGLVLFKLGHDSKTPLGTGVGEIFCGACVKLIKAGMEVVAETSEAICLRGAYDSWKAVDNFDLDNMGGMDSGLEDW
jgi:hypothetical protein